jgi:hypothetical protein
MKNKEYGRDSSTDDVLIEERASARDLTNIYASMLRCHLAGDNASNAWWWQIIRILIMVNAGGSRQQSSHHPLHGFVLWLSNPSKPATAARA